MSNNTTVFVNTIPSYNIYIGYDYINQVGKIISELNFSKVAIITDNNVWAIYENTLSLALEKYNISYEVLVVPHGEHTKSIDTYKIGIDFLSKHRFRRSDVLVAFGGGVIGDLSGFISATYQRGMEFIQIPTTLLSGVDSSVGGKTAINTSYGKNLIGSFKQPKAVICDCSLYATMKDEYFLDGVCETIKYSILSDKALFEQMKTPIQKQDSRLIDIIKLCVSYKASIVSQDEKDTGVRRLLNLGHTIGHCIELCSDYTITHGYAVAIGTCYIAKASYILNLISKQTCLDIINCFKQNNLPTTTNYSVDEIFRHSTIDKKCSDDNITIVLIKDIGDCFLKTMPINEWYNLLKSCMEVQI